ncbi:MAG: hypothetical protein VB875_00210, partial [Pirellulales bacterium]
MVMRFAAGFSVLDQNGRLGIPETGEPDRRVIESKCLTPQLVKPCDGHQEKDSASVQFKGPQVGQVNLQRKIQAWRRTRALDRRWTVSL